MKIEEIKNFYFDLDGTLLNDDKDIPARSVELLRQLKDDGYNVGIITGRPPYMIQHYKNIVEPNLPIVGINGAVITDYNLNFHDPEYIKYIPRATSKEIIQNLLNREVTFLIYTKDVMYYNDPRDDSAWMKWVKATLDKFPANEKWSLNTVDESNYKELDCVKILVISSEASVENMVAIEKYVAQLNGVYPVASQAGVIDIMPINQSKGNALKVLEERGKIDLHETIVFGDARNDIEMLEEAKVSVAMKNAHPKVRAIADFITEFDNNNDGLVKFIKKHFYNKQNQ